MPVIKQRMPVQIEPAEEQKVLEAGISRAAAEAAAAPAAEKLALSEEDPVGSTEQAPAPQAVVARQAWDPEAEEAVVVDAADKPSQTPEAERRTA
jgi:hypothetical protein